MAAVAPSLAITTERRTYTCAEPLGSGATATVYQAIAEPARPTSRPVLVALKVFNPGHQRQVKREAEILSQLPEDCPFLPRLIDAAKNAIAMTLLPGKPAPEMLAESRGQIDLVQRIAFGVVLGLHALHNQRIVHGDIKPANIIVNPDWLGTIADFGAAISLDKPTSPSGSSGYAPPERFGRSPSGVGTADDMWSLGATLFELATGERLLLNESDFTSEDPTDAHHDKWQPRFDAAFPVIRKDLSPDPEEKAEQKKILALKSLILSLLRRRSERADIDVVRQHSFFRSLMVVEVIRSTPFPCKVGAGTDPKKIGTSQLPHEGILVLERAPLLKVVEYRYPYDVEGPLRRPRRPPTDPIGTVTSTYRISDSRDTKIVVYSRL